MGFSATHLLLLLVVFVLLFGRGKISELMSDVAKGIKSFKKGMADDEDEDKRAAAAKPISDASTTRESERSKTP
ncbi:MAG: twin-arginine translocase TatA/TatE family subunit [Hyphomicrobium sp.]